ncbi:MAG: hypothetical protein V3S30_11050 [Thermoanaerobaculia bacterium]
MRFAVNHLKSLYQLPIEQVKSKPFDRTWHGRELVELVESLEDRSDRDRGLAPVSSGDRWLGHQWSSVARPSGGLLFDPSLVAEEYYVRRVGFDRFRLLHGEYFNLNPETLTHWHDLRSLFSCAA